MIIPDVNLLLYATVAGLPQHERAYRWWTDCLNGTTEIGLAGPVVFGLLRLATNARVVRPPMAVPAAVDLMERWLDRPRVRFLLPGPRHTEIAFGLLRSAGTAADLTTDAQIAALAIEYQGEVHSADTDFGRFAGLRWVNPLSS